jgi:HPt (histidine-containing phosphotransfer) domain-containing protein
VTTRGASADEHRSPRRSSVRPEPSVAILDDHVISALRSFGRPAGRLLAEMVAAFVDEAPTLMAEIESSESHGTCADVARAAHKLKGVCGHIGAVRVALASAHVEDLAGKGDRQGLTSAIAATRRELEPAFKAVLRVTRAPPVGPAALPNSGDE